MRMIVVKIFKEKSSLSKKIQHNNNKKYPCTSSNEPNPAVKRWMLLSLPLQPPFGMKVVCSQMLYLALSHTECLTSVYERWVCWLTLVLSVCQKSSFTFNFCLF